MPRLPFWTYYLSCLSLHTKFQVPGLFVLGYGKLNLTFWLCASCFCYLELCISRALCTWLFQIIQVSSNVTSPEGLGWPNSKKSAQSSSYIALFYFHPYSFDYLKLLCSLLFVYVFIVSCVSACRILHQYRKDCFFPCFPCF